MLIHFFYFITSRFFKKKKKKEHFLAAGGQILPPPIAECSVFFDVLPSLDAFYPSTVYNLHKWLPRLICTLINTYNNKMSILRSFLLCKKIIYRSELIITSAVADYFVQNFFKTSQLIRQSLWIHYILVSCKISLLVWCNSYSSERVSASSYVSAKKRLS